MNLPNRKYLLEDINLAFSLSVEDENIDVECINFLHDEKLIKTLKKPKLVPSLMNLNTIDRKTIDSLILTGKDILADKILDGQNDPDYERISALLPQLGSWDFIGTPMSKWKFLVWPDGKIGIQTSFEGNYMADIYFAFDPSKEGFPYASLPSAQGLLDGYLPVSYMLFQEIGVKEIRWEQIAFARTDEKGVTKIFVRVSSDSMGLPIYFVILSPEDKCVHELKEMTYQHAVKLEDGKKFFEELFLLAEESEQLFSNAMRIEVPETRIVQGSLAAILKTFNSYVGNASRYGVTRYLSDKGAAAESFPPTTTTMLEACLAWGFFDKAKGVLDYYLSHYVKSSGQLNHRGNGASISEHGMILDTIVKYVKYTDDYEFLKRHLQSVKNICDWLLLAREEGKQNPPGATEYGLIKGCPEDDLRNWKANYWYSGNSWACRAFIELAKLFVSYGAKIDPSLEGYGKQLASEAIEFKKDILNSLEKSMISDGELLFVPPFPGYDKPFDSMLAEVFYEADADKVLFLSSYVNYRTYMEMLSSDIIGDNLSEAIIAYREQKGGELLGLTRIRMPKKSERLLSVDCFDLPWTGKLLIDDWPLYNYLWSLLRMDKIDKFLMIYYAHMAYSQARGTFFASEHSDLIRFFPPHCIPSQLTIPIASKWMLVFEEKDEELLWLNKAAPRDWLDDGKEIKVVNAPTRWGSVSYHVKSKARQGKLSLKIELSGRMQPDKIVCRLRTARNLKIEKAVCDNKHLLILDLEKDLVIIQPNGRCEFNLEIALTVPPDKR